jgi:hypothetical protein
VIVSVYTPVFVAAQDGALIQINTLCPAVSAAG